MTIYELSIISTTGFPYYNKILQPIPRGVNVHLRFFDYSEEKMENLEDTLMDLQFDLKAGLISALFEFARNINKRIQVLEFSPKNHDGSTNLLEDSLTKLNGDVLITVTTESYLLHNQVKKKINLIYENFINPKIPLDSAYEILSNEEDDILNILTDADAHKRIEKNKNAIMKLTKQYLKDMKGYGLNAIVISGFDLSPLSCFSKGNLCIDDMNEILRNVGKIPAIEPMEWKYRQSFFQGEVMWVYIINSGVGVTVRDVFEPYYYLLLAEPNSYLGEFPAKLTSEFNRILG